MMEFDVNNLFSSNNSKSTVTNSLANSYGGSINIASYLILMLVFKNLATDELKT